MIVRPDEISASSAPSTSPLKHCEMKLAQLITRFHPDRASTRTPHAGIGSPRAHGGSPGARRPCVKILRQRIPRPAPAAGYAARSGVVAELAAERVGLLHHARTRNDFEDLPVVLVVLHVLLGLAADRSEE